MQKIEENNKFVNEQKRLEVEGRRQKSLTQAPLIVPPEFFGVKKEAEVKQENLGEESKMKFPEVFEKMPEISKKLQPAPLIVPPSFIISAPKIQAPKNLCTPELPLPAPIQITLPSSSVIAPRSVLQSKDNSNKSSIPEFLPAPYRPQTALEKTTGSFFSFDWNLKCKPCDIPVDNFTANAYWHYIGNQYFPNRMITYANDPMKELENIRRNILEKPMSKQMEFDFQERSSRISSDGVSLEQNIAELEERLRKVENRNSDCMHGIAAKVKAAFNRSLALDFNDLDLKSADLSLYSSDICTTYTRRDIDLMAYRSHKIETQSEVQSLHPTEIEYLKYLRQLNHKSRILPIEPFKKSKSSKFAIENEDGVCFGCNNRKDEMDNMIVFCSV